MQLQHLTEKNFKKKVSKLSTEQLIELKTKALAQLEKVKADYVETKELYKKENPFWFYEPSDGELNEERMAFLAEFIKPEDMPTRLCGQKDVHLSTASVRAVSGGNRGAKTTTDVIENCIEATGEVPNAMKGWYPKEKIPTKWPRKIRVIGVDFKQLHNTLLPAYQKWSPREFLKAGSWEESYSSQHNRLDFFKSGKKISQIEFMTNEQDVETMQGTDLDKLSIDEECRKDVFKENLLRFGTAEKLNIYMGWTPTKGLTWSHDLFLKGEFDGGSGKVSRFNVESFKLAAVTNRHVNLGVLREILLGLDSYDEVRMRLLGDFISLSGLVYGQCLDPKLDFITPFEVKCECSGPPHVHDCPYRNFLVIRGFDPHEVKPTAAVWLALDRESNVYVYDCYFELANTRSVKEDIARLSEKMRLGWAVMDQSADCDIQAFDGRNIFKELTRGKNAITNVRRSIKHQGSILAGVDIIKQYLKDRRLKFMDKPSVRELYKQLQTLERDTYANEERKGEKDRILESRHDLHAALRYGFQFPLRWYPEVEYIPEPEFADAGALW